MGICKILFLSQLQSNTVVIFRVFVSEFRMFWFGLRPATKAHAAAPPPTGVRRRMETNRQKLVGRDKGSLTEQQTKGTGTTIQIRRKHDTNRTTHRAVLPDRTGAARSRAASEFLLRHRPPLEPSMTAHGM